MAEIEDLIHDEPPAAKEVRRAVSDAVQRWRQGGKRPVRVMMRSEVLDDVMGARWFSSHCYGVEFDPVPMPHGPRFRIAYEQDVWGEC